ncbi:hypothetical protein FHR75_003014 [Kineococcus radiotolerans]|uniref:DUF3499 domain-containing protein n=2 Tax=Kineococcus radiotolerans TaxID=131568 RepID=A6WER7_KINRD|nr:DUF3499 domain-containing protein [Kineococcus radiotolerans]ABS05306.1 conserved hypothetical protein [Kineococcus radiotolerans SRS30216 = ATCC BAA-149]MBB2902183.1 hypothetical protein [Kineococcus radiotolerans]
MSSRTPGTNASRPGAGRSTAPSARRCSRTACGRPAVATLTYVYSDSTAVLGPLATFAEPHCYDLCAEHADRLTAPRGWEVVRLAPDLVEAARQHDDLLAVAEAVRDRPGAPGRGIDPDAPAVRRGHLRVLRES